MPTPKRSTKTPFSPGLPVTFRLTREQRISVEQASIDAGYPNASAFMRASVLRAVRRDDAQSELAAIEARMAASFDAMRQRIRALENASQMMLAFQDATAKLLLTCLPEPSPEVIQAARASAKKRYERLMRAIAHDMTGDVAGVAAEIARHAQE